MTLLLLVLLLSCHDGDTCRFLVNGNKVLMRATLTLLAMLVCTPAFAAEPYTFHGAILKDCDDGDTCRFDLPDQHPVFGKVTWKGRAVRIVGIDAPELHPSHCDAERELGEKAKARLLALLRGAAKVDVEIPANRRDKYGRLLGRILADGQDVGAVLIAEGLARPYTSGRRKGWCP